MYKSPTSTIFLSVEVSHWTMTELELELLLCWIVTPSPSTREPAVDPVIASSWSSVGPPYTTRTVLSSNFCQVKISAVE